MQVKQFEKEAQIGKFTALSTLVLAAKISKARFRPAGAFGLAVLLLIIIWTLSFSLKANKYSSPSLHYSAWKDYLESKISTSTKHHDLVTYVYYETDDAKRNLEFFLAHGLHDAADFIFILNGPSTVTMPDRSNIHIIERNNTCYDLGSHGEILGRNNHELVKKYDRFILMNSSVRGPFLPYWTESPCWSNKFFAKLNEKTKMVGITANCRPVYEYFPHVQSMVLALDRVGLQVIMNNLTCQGDLNSAIRNGETQLTQTIRDAGYKAEGLMSMGMEWGRDRGERWWEDCQSGDPNGPQGYDGMDYHPYDVVFVKTKRLTEPPQQLNDVSLAAQTTLVKLTGWVDQGNFSSYHFC